MRSPVSLHMGGPNWRRLRRFQKVLYLLRRDGPNCFYCGLPLGSSPTLEHLLPRAAGGNDHPSNMCLAHEKCNQVADDRPILDKVILRDLMRKQVLEQ